MRLFSVKLCVDIRSFRMCRLSCQQSVNAPIAQEISELAQDCASLAPAPTAPAPHLHQLPPRPRQIVRRLLLNKPLHQQTALQSAKSPTHLFLQHLPQKPRQIGLLFLRVKLRRGYTYCIIRTDRPLLMLDKTHREINIMQQIL
jgi:hypothetical protein